MRCDDVQPLLSDHLDGTLGPADEAGVAAHLVGCETCRAELAELRMVVEMLRQVPSEPMPGGLFDRISAALAAEPEPVIDEDAVELLPTTPREAAELAAVIGLLHQVPREVVPADLPGRIAAALAREGSTTSEIGAEAPPAVVGAPKIACDEAEDYLTGHLDGSLDAWEAAAVGSHVEACAPCARKLAELSAVVGLLRQVPPEPLPADLPGRVAAALAALDAPNVVPFAPPAKKRAFSHWMSGAAGAVAACAMFLVWNFVPGAGMPRIETAAVSVKQDVAVNIGFDVEESVDGVIFQVDLPEGLKFIDDKAQPMLAQSVSWKGSLEKGKTVVPIVVRGIRPGRYEIEAFVRKGALKRKTTIILPVEG